ncbi:HNH endonuclease [Salmonella phage PVPSE1]|uniref:HNH endonuclease n=1 Tax=Salmonella phage PVPSE1 TaxID=889338 RepID=G3BLN0_9CAUD|nr:HNH endonuclease [Salmonella phage PVPSE1]ADP02410.1 HNH endonuclease [Salmonella phage PVPSE1]
MWKSIENFDGYEVSDKGEVRGKRGSIIKPDTSGRYYRVSLCREGIVTRWMVHRLVAFAFLEPIEGKPYVNHKNGDKTDNSVDNLEWVTQRENQDHAVLTSLCPRGEEIWTSKVTESEVLQIAETLQLELPVSEVARRFSVPFRIVKRIKYRETWEWLTSEYEFFSGRPKLTLLSGERQQIYDLLKYGFPSREVAKMFGVSKTTVLNIKRDFSERVTTSRDECNGVHPSGWKRKAS